MTSVPRGVSRARTCAPLQPNTAPTSQEREMLVTNTAITIRPDPGPIRPDQARSGPIRPDQECVPHRGELGGAKRVSPALAPAQKRRSASSYHVT